MRILLYSANFAPEPTGIGKYSGEMAAWLAGRGHEVRVICAPPYYPSWKVHPDYRWPPYRRETQGRLRIWRAPLWVPANPGGLKRALHLLSFALSSLPIALSQVFWKPQLVLVVAPFLSCAPGALACARLAGARSWLHIQDFEVDAAFEMGLLRGKFLRQLVTGCERALLRRFDVVSTISRKMLERLTEKGVGREQAVHFPNWVSAEQIQPLDRPSTYRGELGLTDGQRVVLFSGTLGPKQGLLIIPQVARLLRHRPDIHFVVCGDGVMKESLAQECAGLANVHLLPLQPLERLCDLLNLADIHLLTQLGGAEDLVLPSKLTGMLASGRPVMATCNPGTEMAAVLSSCGLISPPEDAVALADAIRVLADDPAHRQQLGQAARRFALGHLAAQAILEAFEAQLRRITLDSGLKTSASVAALPDHRHEA